MPFVTEKLIEARRQYEFEQAQKKSDTEKAEEMRHRKLLAKAIVSATREEVQPDGDRVNAYLEPKSEGEGDKDFIERLGLDAAYPVNMLRLGVMGYYEASNYNYTLMFMGSKWCGGFTASSSDYSLKLSSNIAATGTNLACKEEANGPWLPVEFEDEKYKFIRLTSGLFLPSVRAALESESL